jgi:hypothetical protein
MVFSITLPPTTIVPRQTLLRVSRNFRQVCLRVNLLCKLLPIVGSDNLDFADDMTIELLQVASRNPKVLMLLPADHLYRKLLEILAVYVKPHDKPGKAVALRIPIPRDLLGVLEV